jgi:hypothetical protein
MWREIGMIGRDRVLQEIGARAARKRPPFLLTGPRGSGKTALLEWAYDKAPEPKAYISASDSPRDSLVRIARSWGLQHAEDRDGGQVAISRARIKDLERAVLRQPDGLLFIDDINMATPTFINKFKVWRERFATFAAGVPPFAKEDLKRNLWGLKTIEVPPLAKQHRLLLAQRLCEHLGSPHSPRVIAQNCKGFPGRAVAMARGEVDDSGQKTGEEELNLAPVLLLGVAGIMAVRYIGMGMGDTTLYVLGGVGMGVAVVGRFFLMQGMR